ncbi:stage III sporulation protein AB [Tepidibacter hydrothermalis]|uniref:Stage III sporulation protein AB n=1 Tax=Tepidibacter hydrothermalis TaxID=3036126 RepID=A0ABY8E847_9FIRM|nr:stage III sporulation protein AB [Tepidibacter hydrothermalis]WFD09062.1 stage III sporulation protein AB [Tepidibacter hydrothermalis]
MVKIVLIIFILICFFLLGEELYRSFKKKYSDISDLVKVLEVLNMQLEFGLYTLEEVFEKIGNKKEFNISYFFEALSIKLKENNKSLDDIVNESIPIINQKTNLSISEIEEIINLINNLGKSDYYSQKRIIDLAIENLKKNEKEAFLEIKTKGILYKKLSLTMGFLLVIIFL